MTVYFHPCQTWVIPIGFLKSHGWRKPYATQAALYYARGFTDTVTYTGEWDEVSYQYYQSAYANYWYASFGVDWIFLKKTFYRDDDGKSATVKFENGCGDKTITIDFKRYGGGYNPTGYPVTTTAIFYQRDVIYYQWYYGQDYVTVQTRTQHWPSHRYVWGRTYGLGHCRAWRVKLDGAVVTDWGETSNINLLGSTLQIFSSYYWNGYANWRMYAKPQGLTAGKFHTIEIEFSTDPTSDAQGNPNWDGGRKFSQYIYLGLHQLPTITSWGWGWGWWYWCGYYYWTVNRYGQWQRGRWCHYPWYWYRPYGHTEWNRTYNYHAIPQALPLVNPNGFSARTGTTGSIR